MNELDGIRIIALEDGPELDIIAGEGSARAPIWPGMGAQLRSINLISLGAGAATIELRHPSEAVYYVTDGGGAAVDVDAGEVQDVHPGSMVHIDAGTGYVMRAGEAGMALIGGPSPADPSLYEGIG